MRRIVENRLQILAGFTSSKKTAAVFDVLSKAMRDRSPMVRSKAIEIVAERGTAEIVPMVEELLTDKNEQVRIDAVNCLASFTERSTRSREKLRVLLKDGSFLVRIQTLEALVRLRDRVGLPNIADLLSDKNPLVRAYSARSIAAFKGASYVPAIEAALRLEKKNSARAGFMEALLLLGKKEVLGAFLQLLHSSDYRVRCAVANALEDMPLDQFQAEAAINALSQARLHALGVADKSSITRILGKLRKDRRANR
jgi:HEAT repeat protein